MDADRFDTLARALSTGLTRRTAWGAVLAAALFGTASRGILAAPSTPCTKGKHNRCGSDCCPGKCFRNARNGHELCCSGSDEKTGNALIICGTKCCQAVGKNPCDCCLDPGAESVIAATADPCPEGIAGSYRRR